MKERIKLLIEQATFDDPGCSGDPRPFFDKEKFAELLVQECINTLEFHGFDDAVPYIKWMATNKLGVK